MSSLVKQARVMGSCEVCAFNNPKGTVAAVVIKEGKLLVLKRDQEPGRGQWDLPGGFMNEGEAPEAALRRELKEELGVDGATLDLIGWFPGTYVWQGREFAVLSGAFLAELPGEIVINYESSAYQWVPVQEVGELAFDSDQKVLQYVRDTLDVDWAGLQELVRQLDRSASAVEINLYRALLQGYMSKKLVGGRLVGMGWIFPRRTLLRTQAVIEDMVVDERERGRGYGEEILLDLLRWAKARGIEVVELTTNPQRVAANELYKKAGFRLHPTNHYLLELKDWRYGA